MGHSFVDFELSESKFTSGGFFDKTGYESQDIKGVTSSKQGTDSEMANATLKPSGNETKGALNKSGNLSKSIGGGDDDLAISMDDAAFDLSESNFSVKFGQQFVQGTSTGAANSGSKAGFKSVPQNKDLTRERAMTMAEKKSSVMSKNLIAEVDDDLVSETDGLGASSKKKNIADNDDDDSYSDDNDFL